MSRALVLIVLVDLMIWGCASDPLKSPPCHGARTPVNAPVNAASSVQSSTSVPSVSHGAH